MEALQDIIGKDCIDIILDYKQMFERVESNNKSIDSCIFEEVGSSWDIAVTCCVEIAKQVPVVVYNTS